MSAALAFLRAAPPPPGPGERPLAAWPLTVLVGVTGVGKSTALAALRGLGSGVQVLPDRREVTDAVMIGPLAGGPVRDREERFALTARYRETHPGGMAQALGSLVADTAHWTGPLVFDGLRGLDEVQYAAQTFPAWRFVALGAPDRVRVERLLGRADAFDQVAAAGSGQHLRAELAALPGAAQVFSAADLDTLAGLAAQGHAPADLLAKTKIVLSERRHYDPAAAEAFLRTLPPTRALVLDTHRLAPAEVAAAIQGWTGEMP
ncbi:nucleoside/nucleotide kinase family protein [Deinococcus multiflagellatus]|uniref:ATPase n=1 Tax=Deinococcus multiflagellatus TaxID=1656887 RepID=UPI001CCB51DF|nr:ATPase [Deinococcus multiflagellatus]MBZ9714349.1 ATPase [Deinococcus multiflagellatus]